MHPMATRTPSSTVSATKPASKARACRPSTACASDYADGWGLVRASNTTPVLVMRFDADSAEALTRIKADFRSQLLAVEAGPGAAVLSRPEPAAACGRSCAGGAASPLPAQVSRCARLLHGVVALQRRGQVLVDQFALGQLRGQHRPLPQQQLMLGLDVVAGLLRHRLARQFALAGPAEQADQALPAALRRPAAKP